MKADILIAIANFITYMGLKFHAGDSPGSLKRIVKSYLVHFSWLELLLIKCIPWRYLRRVQDVSLRAIWVLLLILSTTITSVYWQSLSQPVSAREINSHIIQTQPSQEHKRDTKISQNKTIKIGVLAFRGVDNAIKIWQPTAKYLTDEISDYTFQIAPLNYETIKSFVQRGEVDFIVTQPAMYVKFEALYGVNRIATLKTSRLGKAYTVFGGVIFRKAFRNDLRLLGDFKGKIFMGADETSLGGWQMAWREFNTAGINPYRDFKQLRFSGKTQDEVVYAVRDGLVDGGTVRTDTLESMAAEGKINLRDFTVINQQNQYHNEFPFALSTRLYPEWPFAVLKHTPTALAEKVAVALLKMPKESAAAKASNSEGWTIPLNYQPVHELLKELHLAPYQNFGKITLNDLIKQFWQWILFVALGFLVLAIATIYFQRQELRSRKRSQIQLKQQAHQLQETLSQLQKAQALLVQHEKMSSMGQLVAGVAHEINNPVSFIYGNLTHIKEYIQVLLKLINLYRHCYPNADPKIAAAIKDDDLEFVIEDLPKILSSMRSGTDRIRQIVLTLRNFSRLDEAEMKRVNIHEGIDSTLLILQNRLKSKSEDSEIKVIKEYGDLPEVECYAGQLNQVFMNILSNAIDALQESLAYDKEPLRDSPVLPRSGKSVSGNAGSQRTNDKRFIRIRTQVFNTDWVRICIEDNGPGITENVKQQLFDPFFTTKPVGKGTGLGLSISYQIVVEKHGGKLKCISELGQGAEFWIEIPIRQSSTINPSL